MGTEILSMFMFSISVLLYLISFTLVSPFLAGWIWECSAIYANHMFKVLTKMTSLPYVSVLPDDFLVDFAMKSQIEVCVVEIMHTHGCLLYMCVCFARYINGSLCCHTGRRGA